MSEYKQFSSYEELPGDWHDFAQLLRDDHERQPFPARNSREACQRVLAVAAEHGLKKAARKYNGRVESPNAADEQHAWVVLLGEYVIDVAYPFHDQTFKDQTFPAFVASGPRAISEMDQASRYTPFEKRVLGNIPPDIAYIGTPTIYAREDYHRPV